MNRLNLAALSTFLFILASGFNAATAADAGNTGKAPAQKEYFKFPAQYMVDVMPNTMTATVTPEAKKKAIQSMMMANPLSLRDMMSMMVTKKQVKEGVSFDDAIDSMKLRANKRNFKFIGDSPLYKDVVAITGKPSPRAEIFSFCDAVIARQILDYSPEFIAFLPCRIALIEDAKGKIWVVTLDWNVTWLDYSQNPNKITNELRANAIKIRDILEDIMTATANGDL
ncbi:MAG TPA: DUF302 domain-containing protein [Sulfuricella sp.]|nr:DUF302 domain-containing protein [Sulfuricella sp.]